VGTIALQALLDDGIEVPEGEVNDPAVFISYAVEDVEGVEGAFHGGEEVLVMVHCLFSCAATRRVPGAAREMDRGTACDGSRRAESRTDVPAVMGYPVERDRRAGKTKGP
jgi:hypothetical protein